MTATKVEISGLVIDQSTGQGVGGVVVSDGIAVVETDGDGGFRLAACKTSRFVFISTPGQYQVVGAFYKEIAAQKSGTPFEFMLEPCAVSDSFYFAQFTDVHLHPTGQFKQFATNRLQPGEQFAVFTGAGREIAEIDPKPKFIAVTGDMAVAINRSEAPEAIEKMKFYVQARNGLELPVHEMIGNHDHVYQALPDDGLDVPEYGTGLFETYLGPTYYSYNYGNWHFVALNTYKMEGRTQHVRVSCDELSWLAADLAAAGENTPIVLLMHELLPDIENRAELLAITSKYNVKAFVAGHFHVNMDYEYSGVRCIVTGSLASGWWWRDQWATPRGYGLFHVDGENLERFYAKCGDPNAVEIQEPQGWSVVSGEVELRAAVLALKFEPTTVSCQVGETDFAAMIKAGRGPWPTWKYQFDSREFPDGSIRLTVRTVNKYGRTETCHRHVIIKNQEGGIGSTDGELVFTVRGSQGPSEVCLNGKKVGKIPYPTVQDTEVRLPARAALLHKVNVISFEPAKLGKDDGIQLNYRSRPVVPGTNGDVYDTFWFNDLRICYEGREYCRAWYRPHAASLVDIERNDLRVSRTAVCVIPTDEERDTMVTSEH